MNKKEKNKKNNKSFISQNKETILIFIIGLFIGALVMSLFFPEKIASLKDGTEPIVSFENSDKETLYITADDLYDEMKSYYSVSLLINKVDKIILEDMYEKTDDETAYINEQIEQLESYAVSNNTTVEAIISSYYGYTSIDEFKDFLSLTYKRLHAVDEYHKSKLTDEEINTYYENNVFGDIYLKYITIALSEDETENNERIELAKEIIEKANNGSSYKNLVKTYKNKITSKDYGYVSFDDIEINSTILTELKSLENNKNSSEYITTNDGYVIVFRGESKDKSNLNSIKDKVKDMIVNSTQYENNETYKVLDTIRKEHNLTFEDTVYDGEYIKYIESTTIATESAN